MELGKRTHNLIMFVCFDPPCSPLSEDYTRDTLIGEPVDRPSLVFIEF
jgi:hypothetical protein